MSHIVTDGHLPITFAKLRQLGMKIAFGLEGYPSNRMIMTYGPPGGGKSTLLYQLAGEYERNGDEVWIVDAERAIDRIYLASYMPPVKTVEGKVDALKYMLKISEASLKKENKLKPEEREVSDEQLDIVTRRCQLLPEMIKATKEGRPPEGIDNRTAAALLRNAIAEYRLRNIKILNYNTLEEFEKDVIKEIEERKKDPKQKLKRLLIGVDSINYLLPAEVLERAASSEGSNFVTAKYLHTMLPKLITKLAGTETSIFVIHQQTTTIKMNFWEQKSPIDDVAAKGGSASKFGATTMVGVERRKKIKDVSDVERDTGLIHIPKAKLRGGSHGTFKGAFYLKETIEESVMDFNEPFVISTMVEELYGIRKNRGKFYAPVTLLEGHPDYETLKGSFVTFPKEEGENLPLYFTGSDKDVAEALLASPAYEEKCLLEYGILSNI